ncbi:MAG: salicylate hydroxylase [Rhizobium sp. 63-7]|nr:MAG: salicylate hydroxylase [Rhizobium sp. 63-7]
MPVRNVAIVGAGIAGLTAALSFARKGISSTVIEQAPELTEVGAGLQVSPNASRILAELGVLASLEAIWMEPDIIELRSGTSLRRLAAVPSGRSARQRWGAPYGVLHRSSLQQALLSAAQDQPLCRLVLGKRLHVADRRAIADIAGTEPDLVVGADGVRSVIRSLVPGAPQARFSGNVAWRITVPDAQAPDFIDRKNVTAFLGPSSHLVCYPLREAGCINLVAIVSKADPEADGRGRTLKHAFSRWHPAIQRLLSDVSAPTFWPLYEAGPGNWQDGAKTVLIGDAAHAMMPFAAQGAAMAIEDAFELAGRAARIPLGAALADFETRRRQRAEQVRRRGAFNKFAYHARGPVRFARDLVLGLRPPQALAADLDWLYGYRAED